MYVHNADFAERIARIAAGENSFKSTIFVGNDETYRPDQLRAAVRKKNWSRPANRPVQSGSRQKPRTFSVLTVPLAFAIGAFAVLLWRFADFQMNGLTGFNVDPTQMLAVNAATGMILAILLCQVASLTTPQHILSAFLGLVLMTVGIGHLVQIAPEQFTQVFSAAWVGEELTKTGTLINIFG